MRRSPGFGVIARRLTMLGVVALAFAGACDGGGGTDSNTNWLDPCDDDDDCGTLQCLCGVCTKTCASAGDCAEFSGAICPVQSRECGCRLSGEAGAGGANAGGQSGGGVSSGGGSGSGGLDAGTGGESGAGGDASVGGSDAGSGGRAESTDGSVGDLDAGPDAPEPPPGPGPLDFSFPTGHSLTDADGLRVSGIVEPPGDVVSITVNSVPAVSLEGNYARWRTSADVPLTPGKNTLRVVAERSSGAPYELTGTVWRYQRAAAGTSISEAMGTLAGDVPRIAGIVRDPVRSAWAVSFDYFSSRTLAWMYDGGLWATPEQVLQDPNHLFPDNAIGMSHLGADSTGALYSAIIGMRFAGPSVIYDVAIAKNRLESAPSSHVDTSLLWADTSSVNPFRFAVDEARGRLLAVRASPRPALVAIDTTTGTATVLSDDGRGSGPPLTPGVPVTLLDADSVLLPGCAGATAVQLSTGNRTTWGQQSSEPCIVTDGTFDGGVIALAQMSPSNGLPPQRWEVRRVDPTARTVSRLFDVTVTSSGSLTTAAIDAARARLAVHIDSPFTIDEYVLPGGGGPHPTSFASGPTTQLLRGNDPYYSGVRRDGRLFVSGSFSTALSPNDWALGPDTGIREPVSRTAFGPSDWIEAYPDALTGESITITSEGVYLVAAESSSSTRIADTPGSPYYDVRARKVYGLDSTGIVSIDVPSGTRHSFPVTAGELVTGCGSQSVRVSPDGRHAYVEAVPTTPGVPGGRCGYSHMDMATGVVTNTIVTRPVFTRDGKAISMEGDALRTIDLATEQATVFSRAPDHGRGYALPQTDRSSLVMDPRRDRLWLTSMDVNRLPIYFVVDPFNGDRVLVSD